MHGKLRTWGGYSILDKKIEAVKQDFIEKLKLYEYVKNQEYKEGNDPVEVLVDFKKSVMILDMETQELTGGYSPLEDLFGNNLVKTLN